MTLGLAKGPRPLPGRMGRASERVAIKGQLYEAALSTDDLGVAAVALVVPHQYAGTDEDLGAAGGVLGERAGAIVDADVIEIEPKVSLPAGSHTEFRLIVGEGAEELLACYAGGPGAWASRWMTRWR